MRCEKTLVASPWTRDLRTGDVVRHVGKVSIATVKSNRGGWMWSVPAGPVGGWREDREQAKALADDGLRRLGVRLVNVPGGCTIESDESKKQQRVYREG